MWVLPGPVCVLGNIFQSGYGNKRNENVLIFRVLMKPFFHIQDPVALRIQINENSSKQIFYRISADTRSYYISSPKLYTPGPISQEH